MQQVAMTSMSSLPRVTTSLTQVVKASLLMPSAPDCLHVVTKIFSSTTLQVTITARVLTKVASTARLKWPHMPLLAPSPSLSSADTPKVPTLLVTCLEVVAVLSVNPLPTVLSLILLALTLLPHQATKVSWLLILVVILVLMSISVAAVTLFGNTRHVAYQVYNVLNGSSVSTDNPRMGASLAAMNQYSNELRDYCDESDPVCAKAGPGPFVVANHLNYFDRYTDDAAAWIKSKVGA
jgi:hypothetical protein